MPDCPAPTRAALGQAFGLVRACTGGEYVSPESCRERNDCRDMHNAPSIISPVLLYAGNGGLVQEILREHAGIMQVLLCVGVTTPIILPESGKLWRYG